MLCPADAPLPLSLDPMSNLTSPQRARFLRAMKRLGKKRAKRHAERLAKTGIDDRAQWFGNPPTPEQGIEFASFAEGDWKLFELYAHADSPTHADYRNFKLIWCGKVGRRKANYWFAYHIPTRAWTKQTERRYLSIMREHDKLLLDLVMPMMIRRIVATKRPAAYLRDASA